MRFPGHDDLYTAVSYTHLDVYKRQEWEVLKGGKVIRTGRVDNLNVAPQQTAKIKLDLGKTCPVSYTHLIDNGWQGCCLR